MKSLLPLGLIATVFTITPALAGFQWTPPHSNPTAIPAPHITPAVPAAIVEKQISRNHPIPHHMQPLAAEPAIIMPDNAPVSARAAATHTPKPSQAPALPTPQPVLSPATVLSPGPAFPMPAPIAPSPMQPMTSPVPVLSSGPAFPMPEPIAPTPMKPLASPVPVLSSGPALPMPALAPTPIPVMAMPMIAQPSVIKHTVVGFGDNLPLALALGDIVPSAYSYAFASGLNPGVQISWDGQGRNWDAVLAEALAPLKLAFQMRGSTVFIAKSLTQVIAPVAIMPPPLMPTAQLHVAKRATPIENMRAPRPPLEPVYTQPMTAAVPFSQSYEPIILTPTAP